MLVSKNTENDLTIDVVDRLLFQGIEDPGGRADCVLVLGSAKASAYRVPVAVDAYRAERAGKIMVCGGVLRDFPSETCSEAAHMRKAAIALGAAETDVLLEDSSQNTIENLLFALIELQRAFCLNRVSGVLLVTSAHHMRRSLCLARYLFPAHIAILPCPANDTHTRRDNWMHTTAGTQRAKNEALNLIGCVRSGLIPDFSV